MTYDLEHLGRQVDKLSDAIEENTSEKGENSMNDIAGLLTAEEKAEWSKFRASLPE